ncbi:folate-binding protein YgfZ [Acidocella sp.]|uniref:CAF17-like 4Fe-4S cluster assembly/insertion protein YgfZ n=1 Tax=Acidocella sp. TaxID=50710 RepID=UPI002639E8D9|nr:folate-binding protein [Acidocella sp.]
MTNIALLPDRAVIAIHGPDRVAFLNGLVSNDVAKAGPGQAVWAALLTPQGRYLTDFFIFATNDALLLDIRRADGALIIQKLRRFRLRMAVEISEPAEDWHVQAAWGGAAPEAPLVAPDPRLPEAGFRMLVHAPLQTTASPAHYGAHRIALGLPDGAPDLEPEQTLLLEAGFDELHGIDWTKGCYMGQELTARTKYRGLVKRRLVPVTLSAPLAPGAVIYAGDAEAGRMGSRVEHSGLAMLRVEALGASLHAGPVTLAPRVPAWMNLARQA